MTDSGEVSQHYAHGDLFERLQAALIEDGADPAHPTVETLAPFDQFHGRGLEATRELAAAVQVSAAHHLLDIGSGIGGPARFMAQRFGCQVTGIDLTEAFCDVARRVTQLVGLEDRVAFQQGDALDMPFADAAYDGAYSMNVSMNIADKRQFYGEIHRVLRPGAWLVLSELALGPEGEPDYPTPWARTGETSFLATQSETMEGLEACGFTIVYSRDAAQETLAFSARSREMVERGEKPPHRAVQLIHGDCAPLAMANTKNGIEQGRLIPIEVLCTKSETA